MARLLLFPERRRCRTCRSYFGFQVVQRLYCSDECAGRSPRPVDIKDLPRCCRVWKGPELGWQPKRVFWSAYRARLFAKRQGLDWYQCDGPDGCGLWHVASPRETTIKE